jgi:hypothetical protein
MASSLQKKLSSPSAQKTIQVLLIADLSFTLGRYSMEFSGSVWAWTAVVCSIFAGTLTLYLMIKDFWKADGQRP